MSCEEGLRPDYNEENEMLGARTRGILSRTIISHLVFATVLIIPLAVIVAVSGRVSLKGDQLSRLPPGRRALLSAVRDLSLSGSARQIVDNNRSKLDTDTVNVTVILEHFELGPQSGEGSPWMFSIGDSPFTEENRTDQAYFANSKFTWNADGKGNTSCRSEGSGKVSRGYIDPFHNFLNLPSALEYTHTVASLTNLELSEFKHINTVDSSSNWDTMGQAGDSRRYKNGVLEIKEDDRPLLKASQVQWIQNISYPAPAGPSRPGVFELSAYFVAKIDMMASDADWVRRLDPQGLGYTLGIVTGGSFGAPTCYTSNSYWVTLRGFPKYRNSEHNANTGLSGEKTGSYAGSPDTAVSMAKTLASFATRAVTAVTIAAVGSSVSSAGVAATGGQAPSPPSGGVVTLLKTAAFTAKLSQIPGFHTDTMKAFGSGLDPFLLRYDQPFGSREKPAEGTTRVVSLLSGFVRQETDVESGSSPPSTISDDLFKGNAFFCTLIIVAFSLTQLCLWFFTEKKPVETRVESQAWMMYLFSVVMSYLYTGSVLASMQYFRSNIPYGTGKPGIYFVAGCQLLLIGIGFTVFYLALMVLALHMLRQEKVRWVPKELLADPHLRRSANIAGEYEAGHRAWFHKLFQCYYSQMAGPRVWLAAIELSMVFVDALLTALIWNQVVCLGLLVSLYCVMFLLFVGLFPHRDKVQGILVIILLFIELLAYVLELIGSVGDYEVAEKCENGVVILGFMGIIFAVVIAIYCDVIPTGKQFCAVLRKHFFKTKELELELKEIKLESGRSLSSSDWSGLQSDDEQSGRRIEDQALDYPRDSDALVTYNAEREARTEETIARIFVSKSDASSLKEESSPGPPQDSAF